MRSDIKTVRDSLRKTVELLEKVDGDMPCNIAHLSIYPLGNENTRKVIKAFGMGVNEGPQRVMNDDWFSDYLPALGLIIYTGDEQ